MKKIFVYLKVWKNDHTVYIYVLKILGFLLTIIYFIFTFFNKKKTKEFNQEKNYFVNLRKREIQKYNKSADDEFNKRFLKNDRYDFRGIYLPKIKNTSSMRLVYEDSLLVYTEKNDDYNYKIVNELEKTLSEGTYCYNGPNGEDINIKKGYTVIDAGAWIGDFSAYASKKDANVYAFEPSPSNIKLLKKTIEYNKNNGGSIIIVPYGLGEKEETLEFYENNEDGTGNSFGIEKGGGNIKLNITTIDIWAEKNNIKKIDFIKSDIEGYERNMLRGAVKTLKKDAPILSICTYRLPDDEKVLKDIILGANPEYKIIQRKMKLFAYVDKK